MDVILFAIIVGLVLAHELGHFVMARRAGVRVHEFGIGFPPRAAILYRGRETLYTLNWLPIGGFVRLEGEEGESFDPRAFVNQRLSTRLRILIAGVVVNFALAWVIFTLIASFADPVYEMRVGAVAPSSPAARVGLIASEVVEVRTIERQEADGTTTPVDLTVFDESGDVITAIDGQRFPVFDHISAVRDGGSRRPPPLRYLDEHAGESVRLTVRRPDGSVEDLDVALMAVSQGTLGITAPVPLPQATTTNGAVDAMAMGLHRTAEASMLILAGVADLLRSIVEGGQPAVSGPVGMAGIVGTVRTGLPPVFLVWFVGLLSANLAVINALPLPPLDGGRVTMALAQALSRDRVSPAVERAAYATGFVMLMVLLAWVTIADIERSIG